MPAKKSYSVAEARDHFTEILRDVESGAEIEVTRRGKPVAVMVMPDRRDRAMASRENDFSRAYEALRRRYDLDRIGLREDEWRDPRDRSPGREVEL